MKRRLCLLICGRSKFFKTMRLVFYRQDFGSLNADSHAYT